MIISKFLISLSSIILVSALSFKHPKNDLFEPKILTGTITSLIQTARKIIDNKIEPESLIGEGTARLNASDKKKLYEDSVAETISVYHKAMNNARETTLAQRSSSGNLANDIIYREPACSVVEVMDIGVAVDPTNIFNLDQLSMKITKNNLIFLKDINDPNSLVKSLSLEQIETPIETVQFSRKCLRVYIDSEPLVLCAQTDSERNNIMKKITEAVFCINSGISLKEKINKAHDSGFSDTPLGMPAFTTKDLRWVEQIAKRQLSLAGKVQSNVFNWLKTRGVQHVVVKDTLGSNPVITVNGEKV